MKLTNLIAIIETHAPPTGAATWDKSGIQIAGRRTDCHKLAVSLDPSPQSMVDALNWGADLVLTHHPLALVPRFLDRIDEYHTVTSLFLKAEAWLYSAHTSLDVMPYGPAGWLADALKLSNRALLEPTGLDQGFGIVGDLPALLLWPRFLARMASTVTAPYLLHIGPTPTRIARIAYCLGAGAQFAQTALVAGAQVYLTGDIKYHHALQAPLPMLDVGHFVLEEEMMRRLALLLAKDPTLARTGINIRFFPGRNPYRPIIDPLRANQVSGSPPASHPTLALDRQ